MILAVDIGNSSISFGAFEGSELKQTFAYPTEDIVAPISPDSLFEVFKTLSDITTAAIASVVPEATEEVKRLLAAAFPSATIVLIRNSNIPMVNQYHQPDRLGTDRLLGALAAYQYYSKETKRPAIIVDLGTATTYDCITATGEYLGGIIALGIASTMHALSAAASQLPEVTLQFPPSVLGKTTEESIQSGILFGALTSLEGLIDRLQKEAFDGEKPMVIVTGGHSSIIKDHTSIVDHYDPHLVLRGILMAAISL
jgi:type III pantothenate kinase